MNFNLKMEITALGIALQTYKICTENVLLRVFSLADKEEFENKESFVKRLNELSVLKEPISVTLFSKGLELLELHEKKSIRVLSIFESDYPSSLRIISRPPALLYVRGNSSLLNKVPGVAVVGSREVSTAGAEITRRIVHRLVKENYCIVSGLAIGVDSAAHRAALSAKGKTIAVLAHGLEEAKPKQNSRLGEEILESGGTWLSEFPIGRPPLKQSFVQRNRIQVGLSAGSVIIEAALNSGSMTQAEFCNHEKRPLFCVVPETPQNNLSLNCEGTVELVKRQLAYPLKTKLDYDYLIKNLNQGRKDIDSRASNMFKTVSMF